MAARLLIGNNLLRRFTPFSCVCAGARDYEMAEKCFMIENPEKCEPKLSGAEHVLITRPWLEAVQSTVSTCAEKDLFSLAKLFK